MGQRKKFSMKNTVDLIIAEFTDLIITADWLIFMLLQISVLITEIDITDSDLLLFIRANVADVHAIYIKLCAKLQFCICSWKELIIRNHIFNYIVREPIELH